MIRIFLLCFVPFFVSSCATSRADLNLPASLPDRDDETLYVWYNPGDPEGLDQGVIPGDGQAVGMVHNLANRTGKIMDLVNGDPKPVFRQNAIQGWPALEFDGESRIYSSTVPESELISPKTVFIVAQIDPEGMGRYLYDGTTGTQRNAMLTGQSTNPNQWSFFNGTAAFDSEVPIATGVCQVHTVVIEADRMIHFINGKEVGRQDGVVNGVWRMLILGGRYTQTHLMIGQVMEFLVYDRSLADDRREAVEAYLMAKYLSPVRILEPDLEMVVTEGDTKGDTYQISLSESPDSPVWIHVYADNNELDLGEGPGQAITLTFDAENWQAPQTITLLAVDDNLSEGPHAGVIRHEVSSEDSAFEGVYVPAVHVSIIDNERYCGDSKTIYLDGDLNRDCRIDLSDFSVLVLDWLKCTDPGKAACYPYLPTEPLYQVNVFESGQDGINTYRIPALITAPDGSVLAFCEARKVSSRDKSPTLMALKRSTDRGETWGPIQILRDVGQDAAMDPTPVVDEITGRVWLFYEVWPQGWDNNPVAGLSYPSTTIWAQYSDDNGINWSSPRDITAQVKLADWDYYAHGPGVGIQLASGPYAGRLVIPCHHRGGTVGRQHFYYSDDHGVTWQLQTGELDVASESQMVELVVGSLLWNMRGGGTSGRLISTSDDWGGTWSSVSYDPELIEPGGCQASILRLSRTDLGDDQNRILFSNPASGTSRVNMTVRMSYDECQSWPVSRQIYAGSSAYSCLTVLSDGQIGLLYEADNYSKIVFARFSVKWLSEGKDPWIRH